MISDPDSKHAFAERRLVDRALGGGQLEARELVTQLAPIIQARVVKLLWRHRAATRASRQDVLDLTQEVFALLLKDAGRVLRSWDAERGLSLRNFVGLVAERHVLSTLRRRSADENEELDAGAYLAPVHAEERAILSRDLLTKLAESLRLSLSPLGLELFYRLYVDEQSIEQIHADCGLSMAAIYQWRTRLRRLTRQLVRRLEGLPDEEESATGDKELA